AAQGSGQPVYSRYEQERIAHALARVAGVPDTDPKGKRVESVEVVAFDVFEPDDPVPQFLNWFHVTTKNHVIEREVLLPIGSHYDQRLADETRRNLVNLELFSVVVVMPLRGTSPDSVRLLVLTKDLWSLRLNWNGRYNKGTIDYLSLQPTEQNLFGSGRQVFGILVFGPRTYTVGAGFYEPRLDDSHISISANVQAIVNCQRGEVEGSTGSFQYALPLYSTSTPWSYGTSLSWSHGRALFPLIGNQGDGTICSQPSTQTSLVSISGTGKIAEYPDYYLFDSESFSQGFTRSFGRIYKTNLSFGIEATRAAYTAVDLTNIHDVSQLPEPSTAELDGGSQIYPGTWFSARHVPENAQPPANFSAAFYRGLSALTDAERARVVAFYERQLPIGNRRISPFFQIQSFTTNFERDLNVETLALTEDYRLGHIATLRIYPALRDIGSSRNLLGVQASASYAFAVGTGYLKAGASNAIELSRPDQTDASLALSLRFNSPRLLLGRFIYDVEFTDHYRNYRNTSFTLGGTSRLRGYENTADFGQNLFVSNLEFRTRPLEIFTVQLAGVLFHDMGDAFNGFDKIHLLQGAGLGLRFLAPQLDRDVFRIDLGFPIPADAPHGEISVIATFGQAFPSP
ncbi:MAG TPA: hypothetical protein VG963_09445, partial [Polyangiaceae bacterium]|nr:hypothetical protein [Polyangiaceae bacterium]